jgi:hypothetical protein
LAENEHSKYLPLLNGVVIAEQMTSNIRIVQSVLRANRKNTQEPNKKAKIIVPLLNYDEQSMLQKNNSHLKEILVQMGVEDKMILTKVMATNMNVGEISKNRPTSKAVPAEFNKNDIDILNKLNLKDIARAEFVISYEHAKRIIASKGVLVDSIEKYLELCDQDIRLPRDPAGVFGKSFSWPDYLGITGKYYSHDECLSMIGKYLALGSVSIGVEYSATVQKLCELDGKFPPAEFWLGYYHLEYLGELFKTIKKKSKK